MRTNPQFDALLQKGAGHILEALKGTGLTSDERVELAKCAVQRGILASLMVSTAHPTENSCAVSVADRLLGRRDWCFLPVTQDSLRLMVFGAEREAGFLDEFYEEFGSRVLAGPKSDRGVICKSLSELDDESARQVRAAFPNIGEDELFSANLSGHLWACRWPSDAQPEFRHLSVVDGRSWTWPGESEPASLAPGQACMP